MERAAHARGAGGGGAFLAHAWLPAVLPPAATRFRVLDRDLAYTLREAGATLVEEGADVEIAPADAISGTARLAVVVESLARDSPLRPIQVATRIAAASALRARARSSRDELRRRGYREIAVLPWDLEQTIAVPAAARRSGVASRFPRRAVLVASRGPLPEPTLAAVAREASRAAAGKVDAPSPLVRAGTLVVLSAAGVLRIAVGPAARQIEAQSRVLAGISAARPPQRVVSQVPELLAHGRAGLACWSLEQMLPGRPAPHDAPATLLADCVEFLVALGDLRLDGGRRRWRAAEIADRVGASPALEKVAARIDEELADVIPVFSHGDFCTSNLLVDGTRLAGVVDWDGARLRPPALDLLHLTLLAASRADLYGWGGAVAGRLLPLARAGGDELTRTYLRRVGVRAVPRRLEALAAAYWLDRVAHQLDAYVERRRDAVWRTRSVDRVLRALAE